ARLAARGGRGPRAVDDEGRQVRRLRGPAGRAGPAQARSVAGHPDHARDGPGPPGRPSTGRAPRRVRGVRVLDRRRDRRGVPGPRRLAHRPRRQGRGRRLQDHHRRQPPRLRVLGREVRLLPAGPVLPGRPGRPRPRRARVRVRRPGEGSALLGRRLRAAARRPRDRPGAQRPGPADLPRLHRGRRVARLLQRHPASRPAPVGLLPAHGGLLVSTQTISLPSRRTDGVTPVGRAASQATVVVQSRAVAEVAAAVQVAQANPRDIDRAVADMRDTCGRLPVANRTFYALPNRGQGMRVRLLRELARIWGNTDYGVRELRRDDDAGVSEMQAWAWDQQTNTRSTRSFIQPHQRMKGRERQALVDLNDIYLSNQNTGARAVRECIASVLPDWFIAEAQAVCETTLNNGEGKSAEERSREAVQAFSQHGVTRAQLEDYVGAKFGKW